MDELTLLGVAIALGMDTLAVCAAVAATLPRLTYRHTFRLTWHFGLFQALMTVLGWGVAGHLSRFVLHINHWIAFGLLSVLGAKMIFGSRHPENRTVDYDPTRGLSLVALSVATSLDALAVGASFNLLGIPVWWPALVIGVVALATSFVGTRLGLYGGSYLGKWAEFCGGLVLIAIGVRILIEHL